MGAWYPRRVWTDTGGEGLSYNALRHSQFFRISREQSTLEFKYNKVPQETTVPPSHIPINNASPPFGLGHPSASDDRSVKIFSPYK